MLDLEGVLIATAIPPPKRHANKDYGLRPNAHQFMEDSFLLFDQVYLNTCVRKEKALEIMQDIFNTGRALYYTWDKTSQFGKASGYEKFYDSKIIHIEDEPSKNKEAKRIIGLGHTYISVPTWTCYDAYVKNDKTDVVLLNVINTIKEKLI